MTVYVAEIAGRPIVAFQSETKLEAQSMVAADWFRAELSVLESGNRPLWDGHSEIHVREALEDERAQWDSSRAKAILAGEAEEDDEGFLTYLVPVRDPTDEGHEDDD